MSDYTTDDFTTAARAEAEKRWPRDLLGDHPLPGPARMNRRIGFDLGAQWAREQEPTDAEAAAYLAAFSEDLPEDTEWTPDTIARVKRGLTAARKARR